MKRRLMILMALAMVFCVTPTAAWANMQWQRWQDPREGAFTLAVPTGWQVQGGLIRHASVDVRLDVLLTSPDGSILVRIGDSVIPPFVQPTQFMAQHGFGEGRWYSPGYGVKFLVMRYLPASYFMTQWYLPQRVGQVKKVMVRVHQTRARQSSQMLSQLGLPVRVDIADMTFQANTPQGRRNGYAMVQTRIINVPNSQVATWEVVKMAGYMAAPKAEALAARVYAGVVGSFQWNQRWFNQQMQAVGATSNIVRQADNEILQIIQSVAKNRQDAADRAHEKWSEYIRGTRTMPNQWGEEQTISNEYDNYIMTPDGQVFGQNQDMADENYAVGQDGNMYKME